MVQKHAGKLVRLASGSEIKILGIFMVLISSFHDLKSSCLYSVYF